MSTEDNEMLNIVREAIEDLNAERPDEPPVGVAPDSVLFGKGGSLDSLGLVNLIVGVEDGIRRRMGIDVTLADDRAMSQSRSPFRTVGALSEYAAMRVEEQRAGG